MIQHPHQTFDDIVDVGEVPDHPAFVVDRDLLVCQASPRVNLNKAISGLPQGPYTVKNLRPVVGNRNRC